MVLLAFATPPSTRIADVVETIHGVPVHDPYRWLEDGDSEEVKAWTAAQNRYTRGALDGAPGRAWLERRLGQWYETGSLGAPVARSRGKSVRLFYTRRQGRQNQPVLYVREGTRGKDRVLVDVNVLAGDGTAALDWWYPSQDGSLVAYGISTAGSETSTLRVREVGSGRDLDDTIPNTRACSLAWLAANEGFYYTRYPAPGSVPPGEEHYHREVYYHRLGSAPVGDPRVFGAELGPSAWSNVQLSPSGRYLAIEVSEGWSKSELYLLDRERGGAPVAIVSGRPATFHIADMLDDRFYVLSNEGAPRYQLFEVDPVRPERERWKLLIPEAANTLEAAVATRSGLVALYLERATSRVTVFSAAGQPLHDVALPALGTVTALHGRHDRADVYLSFSSFLVPTQVLRHDLGTGRTSLWRGLSAPLPSPAFAVEQVRYKSKDGTEIPMFLVHKPGLVRDGANATLLYGYGGFNISLTPDFAAWIAPFIEAGGVYAVANLRGGGEYGETWHRQGMLADKQNVFDDFIAAAEYLIAERITSFQHLAIAGRSNGGLLVAAAVTQRPELFRAALCGVPLTDMIRYPLLQVARLWIPEYGSPDKVEDFAWLYAYSPYHHVRDGVRYPATLILSAESDTRVDPMHARKFAARLQHANAGDMPILLRMESQAGHGAGKPMAKLVAQHTDELAFLFAALAMRAP